MRRVAMIGALFALLALPASASAQFNDFQKNGRTKGPSTFANGVACSSGPQCTSGNCVNSVCCNTACGGACDACSIASGAVSDGTCANVAAASAGSPSCTPYLCSGASASCPATCSVNGDCIASHQCSAGVCVVDDFFTYLLSAPNLASQCTDALLVSDQADAITCTRASTAYCTKADGSMVLHSNNRCRVEQYGVLMEASKTNYALHSEDATNAVWTKSGTTITADTHAAPWGGTTLDTHTYSSGRATFQSVSFASSTGPFVLSAYGRAVSGTHAAGLNIYCPGGGLTGCTCRRADGSACTITANSGDCIGDSTFTTTVDRMEISASCTATAGILGIYNATAQGVTSGAHVWGGMQVERAVSFASSYIPTAGTAVTRLRDLLFTTLTQSIDAAGCFAATARHGRVFNGINGWISTDQVGLYAGSATTIEAVTSAGGASITVPSLLSTSTTARAWWDATVTGVESGGTSDTSSGGTMSSDSIISFGDYLDGHVRGIRVNTNVGGCQ